MSIEIKNSNDINVAKLEEIYKSLDLKSDHELTRLALDHIQRVFYKRKVWRRRRWLGVSCHQNPMDQWMIQEILWDVQPDLVIETGTRHGGSALYYASILELIGKGKVVTVDIKPDHRKEISGWCKNERLARNEQLFSKRVVTLEGSSVDEDVLREMNKYAKEAKTVLVILDSDHREEHVLNELRNYADFVTPGSYLILQDTNLNGHPVPWNFGPGPMEALNKWLKEDNRFEIDKSIEEILFTWHPNGYLRRKEK